jgi:hypothetical protein
MAVLATLKATLAPTAAAVRIPTVERLATGRRPDKGSSTEGRVRRGAGGIAAAGGTRKLVRLTRRT